MIERNKQREREREKERERERERERKREREKGSNNSSNLLSYLRKVVYTGFRIGYSPSYHIILTIINEVGSANSVAPNNLTTCG